jgi:hypothetical protein
LLLLKDLLHLCLLVLVVLVLAAVLELLEESFPFVDLILKSS